MTDIKPENTLFNPQTKRGFLIDLGGVVIKKDKLSLQSCSLSGLEITPFYAAPEINNEENETIDITKALSYSLGTMLESLGLMNLEENKEKKKVMELISLMKKAQPSGRIDVSDALEILMKIGEENDNGTQKLLEGFVAKVQEELQTEEGTTKSK